MTLDLDAIDLLCQNATAELRDVTRTTGEVSLMHVLDLVETTVPELVAELRTARQALDNEARLQVQETDGLMAENTELRARIQSLAGNIVAVEQREHELRARIAAALALHAPCDCSPHLWLDGPQCLGCEKTWPCPTVRALNPENPE